MMEIENDLGDGTTEVNLEIEEALYCTKLGLETILRCHMAGIPTTDLPEMIRLRGEYLAQEPYDEVDTHTMDITRKEEDE
jgi:hypothetical protein